MAHAIPEDNPFWQMSMFENISRMDSALSGSIKNSYLEEKSGWKQQGTSSQQTWSWTFVEIFKSHQGRLPTFDNFRFVIGATLQINPLVLFIENLCERCKKLARFFLSFRPADSKSESFQTRTVSPVNYIWHNKNEPISWASVCNCLFQRVLV